MGLVNDGNCSGVTGGGRTASGDSDTLQGDTRMK